MSSSDKDPPRSRRTPLRSESHEEPPLDPTLEGPLQPAILAAHLNVDSAGERDELEHCSTVDLLERARNGNDVAWEVVFRRCVRGLRRLAAKRLPPQSRGMHEIDDLVQDTVVRALCSPTFARRSSTASSTK
jgi:hypothetical protein